MVGHLEDKVHPEPNKQLEALDMAQEDLRIAALGTHNPEALSDERAYRSKRIKSLLSNVIPAYKAGPYSR